jgi:hypothetical protein
MQLPRIALLTVSIALFLSGCATSRSTIDVSVLQPQQVPTKGFAKILEVKDMRRFVPAPSDPSVPSLQNTSEINNPAITSRAVARKRGGYGKAFADILLPEGRTVEQVVREAATKALAEKGYAVVSERSPEFSQASPVNIEIQQFWSWFSPGFFQVSVEFLGVVLLKGDVLAEGHEQPVRGYSIVKAMAATDSQWQEVLQNGVQDLIEKMKAKIKSPS